MKFFNKVGDFLTADSPLVPSEDFNQSFFVRLFSILGILILFIYMAGSLLAPDQSSLNILRMAAAGLLMINLLLHFFISQYTDEMAGRVLLSVFAAFFLLLVIMGRIQTYNLFWLPSFPVIALLSTGRKGNLMATIFLIVVATALFLPSSEAYINQLTLSQKLVFLVTYVGISWLIIYFKQMMATILDDRYTQVEQLQDEL